MAVLEMCWRTAHLHGEAWISSHRLRKKIFVERQGWEVPVDEDLEYDEFDNPKAKYIMWLDDAGEARGVVRLLPTTSTYMIEKLWPDLVDGELPKAPNVWEATRFGCGRFCSIW